MNKPNESDSNPFNNDIQKDSLDRSLAQILAVEKAKVFLDQKNYEAVIHALAGFEPSDNPEIAFLFRYGCLRFAIESEQIGGTLFRNELYILVYLYCNLGNGQNCAKITSMMVDILKIGCELNYIASRDSIEIINEQKGVRDGLRNIICSLLRAERDKEFFFKRTILLKYLELMQKTER